MILAHCSGWAPQGPPTADRVSLNNGRPVHRNELSHRKGEVCPHVDAGMRLDNYSGAHSSGVVKMPSSMQEGNLPLFGGWVAPNGFDQQSDSPLPENKNKRDYFRTVFELFREGRKTPKTNRPTLICGLAHFDLATKF